MEDLQGGCAVKELTVATSTTCAKGTAAQEIRPHLKSRPDTQIQVSGRGFHDNFEIANRERSLNEGCRSKRKATGSFDFPSTSDTRGGALEGFTCNAGRVTFEASAR